MHEIKLYMYVHSLNSVELLSAILVGPYSVILNQACLYFLFLFFILVEMTELKHLNYMFSIPIKNRINTTDNGNNDKLKIIYSNWAPLGAINVSKNTKINAKNAMLILSLVTSKIDDCTVQLAPYFILIVIH